MTYRFEPRDLEALRSGNKPNTQRAAGLSLFRTYTIVARTQARKNEWETWVAGVLKDEPDLQINGIIERVEGAHGVKLSLAGVSRIRKNLGLAPDTIQSRRGKAKFERKAA